MSESRAEIRPGTADTSPIDPTAMLAGIPETLRSRSQALGDKTFISFLDDHEDLTYSQLLRESSELARGLLSEGMEPGDRIGLFLPASRSYVVSWFASLSAGLVDVPISTELSGRLLQYALERGEVSVIVTDREGLATIATLPDEVRTQLRLAIIANGKAPDSALEPIRVVDLETAASRGGDQALPACDATGLASLRYTSGSTGPPKAIMVSQAHMLSRAAAWCWCMGVGPQDVLYTTFPLYHTFASINGILVCLWSGSTLALSRRFSASQYWDRIRQSKATVAQILDPLASILMKAPATRSDKDHQLRVMGPTIREHPGFEERFGVELRGYYAMSEINVATLYRPGEGIPSGSCGRPTPFFDLQVVDLNDVPCPPDVEGEIVVRPKVPNTMMLGYYRDHDLTVRTWRNLWFHTNDRGRLDREGYLYFSGRSGDAIRRRGVMVSGEQLEDMVSQHPAVVESAVVAVPSDLGEDDIKLCVVPMPGNTLEPADIIEWLTKRVPRHLVPRFIEIRASLPKTDMGKIQRAALRSEGSRGLTARTWDQERETFVGEQS